MKNGGTETNRKIVNRRRGKAESLKNIKNDVVAVKKKRWMWVKIPSLIVN